MPKSLRSQLARQPKPSKTSRGDDTSSPSRYVQMLLQQGEISKLHNILAAFFVWLLLAGFLVFPGTFTTIQKSLKKVSGNTLGDRVAKLVLQTAKNIPLLAVASVMCGIAIIGMIWLATRHSKNYVWLINKLFLPGMTTSLAGLVSTLIGVYTQQKGVWSVMAKVTAIVEGASLGICGILFLIYQMALLRRVKKNHYRWPGQR